MSPIWWPIILTIAFVIVGVYRFYHLCFNSGDLSLRPLQAVLWFIPILVTWIVYSVIITIYE